MIHTPQSAGCLVRSYLRDRATKAQLVLDQRYSENHEFVVKVNTLIREKADKGKTSVDIPLSRKSITAELQVCYLFEQVGYTVGVDRDDVVTISWDAFVGDWWK